MLFLSYSFCSLISANTKTTQQSEKPVETVKTESFNMVKNVISIDTKNKLISCLLMPSSKTQTKELFKTTLNQRNLFN